MEIHTCLGNDVQAFSFVDQDLEPLRWAFPDASIVIHESSDSLLAGAACADYVLTWDFESAWYAQFPRLQAVLTPAAGDDWVKPDPDRRVDVLHGSFHGSILAESLLSALLYMNHRGPLMGRNFSEHGWNRNLQTESRLLKNQRVLIIGYGNIGRICGELIRSLGAEVIGVRQTTASSDGGIPVYPVNQLDALLPEADHVALLLPATEQTNAFMDEQRIRQCKPGVYLYNFGRGNSLLNRDLIATADHIGGAFLDVTEEEPLPASSKLWELDNIMITPHSSCIYQEYKVYFIREVIDRLRDRLTP